VNHASFRLELRDGRILKGRRLTGAARAARVVTILGLMDRRYFPRVIAQSGAALLEEWRAGEPLDPLHTDPVLARQCGEILGGVHRAPPPAVKVPSISRPADRLSRLEEQAGGLERQGALSTASRRRLITLARAHVPSDAAIGVIHGDFCAENLVCDVAGQPHVIDNEALQVGALDFDLARTWYRWPMMDRQATAFLDGYAVHRSPASYLSHFSFWILAVLVDASLFHLRTGTGRASDALGPLHAFLDGSLAGRRWIPLR
jgi:aminoglycoside phosphotransferase (APT) family kinase protein